MSSTFYLDSKRQHSLNSDNLTLALYHFSSGVSEVLDDVSDNDRDLTLTGYAGTYGGQASGYVGRALDFDGTSQYATLGGTSFLRSSIQSGTVQAQVYLPTWRPSGTIVDVGGAIRLSYNNPSGAFEAFITDGTASGFLYTTSSGHIGDWNYLAFQWASGSATSYASGSCKLFFDGEVEYTFSGVVPHPNPGTSASRIGARTNATDIMYPNSRVDELMIGNWQTDDEIRNHYFREKELYTLSVSRGATHIADGFTARIWNPNAKKATKYSQFNNIEIQSRDRKLFTGRIENVSKDKSLGDILVLEGRDFRAELTDRYILESYASGIDTGAIVSDIVNKYSRNLTNKDISTTGHLLQGVRTFAGQSAAYAIYTLAREDNFAAHAHIHTDGTYEFHYNANMSTDSGYSLKEGSDFIFQVKKTDSGFDTINKATVVGGGSSQLIASSDNFDSQSTLGLTKEFFKVDQSLTVQGDVDKAAQSYVDQQAEVQYIELKVLLTTPNTTFELLNPGDLITLNIPTHSINNEQFLVLDIVIDFPEGTVFLKLSNYRKEIEDYLFQLIAAQKQKESENLSVQTLPKIINVSDTIKIRERQITISDRDLRTSFIVGDSTLGKVGRT